MHIPWLSLLIALPIVGAITTCFSPDIQRARMVVTVVAGLELIIALWVLLLFDADQGGKFQLLERYQWIPSLNIEYALGVDGLAILFLPLSAFITLIVILASWNSFSVISVNYYALLLVLQGFTTGIFCALDLILFFFFWELVFPVIFFLVGFWGVGAHRREAAAKYILFMLLGSSAFLLAIVILAVNAKQPVDDSLSSIQLVFSLPDLLGSPLPYELQSLVFLLLMLSFVIKIPLFPFHTWLPSIITEGTTSVIVFHTGLNLGLFALIRLALPLAPSAAVQYSWLLGSFGAITMIYAAVIALYQTNMRRLFAYTCISQSGLVVVGIAALNLSGIQGALIQLFNFTLVASSLMLIAGFIQLRLGSTEVVHLGGLAVVMPKLTCFYFIFAMAVMAVPGTSGFPAVLLIIMGTLDGHTSLGIVVLVSLILTVAYFFDFARKAYFGPIRHKFVEQLYDLRPREVVILAIPALMVLIVGVLPNTLLNFNKKAAEQWLSQILEQPITKDEVADIYHLIDIPKP